MRPPPIERVLKNMKLLFLPYMAIYYSFLPIPQNVSKFYNGRCPVLCDLSAGHDRSAELNTIHCLWSDVSQYMHAWEREGRQLMWLSVFRNCIKCGLEQSIKLLVGRGDGGGEIINPAHIAQ